MKNILLLTATITPKAEQPGLAVYDVSVRLKEYIEALSFYVALIDAQTIDGIVFAENSGADLSELKRSFPSPKIDWISCYDLDYPKEYHRGYGEFRLIDFAYDKSKLLANLSESDFIWKISGRYVLKNMKSMISKMKCRTDLYSRITDKWFELSVVGWSNRGYAAFLRGKWKLFTSDMAPELTLASELCLWQRQNTSMLVIKDYQWPPYLVGRRGSDGSSYQGRFAPFRHVIRATGALMRLKLL